MYEHPASPFVYQFLGDVNLFHGRVRAGRAYIDQVEVALDDHHNLQDAPALVYARPHEIEIAQQPNGSDGIEAIVRRVQPLGAVVRVELEGRDGAVIEAEMTRERYVSHQFKPGQSVSVRPRTSRVFIKDKGEQ